MGRELRRKQAKKEGKSLQKEEIKETNEIKKFIRITLLLIFIGCIIYIASALFITKELHWFGLNKEETTTQNTVKDSIVAGSIFKQKEESYYVYFYDFNGEIDSDITNKVSNITDKVYKVDTASGLNSNYVTSEGSGNKGAKSLSELKVVSPTVIKITANEITEYYEGNEILNIK